ncbi:MAG: SGNH/GDSL hydrolase family protein [Alphaproteobacteria bacterium]|nr:SGNH/GDSL hydrolase family protein [Alphaproteobacteria bacterium]
MRTRLLWLVPAIILFATVITVGVAGVAEMALRASGALLSKGAAVDALLFQYAPYVMSKLPSNLSLGDCGHELEKLGRVLCKDSARPFDGPSFRTNSLGFRSPEFPPEGSKSPEEIRIAITGGSAALSWGVLEPDSLDVLLQKRLAELFPSRKVTVYNLANPAWKSTQEMLAVHLHAPRIQPDVVIHFSGFNDIFHSFFMPPGTAYNDGMLQSAFNRHTAFVRGGLSDWLQQYRIGGWVASLFAAKPVVLSKPDAAPVDAFPQQAAGTGPGRMATRLSLPLDVENVAARTDFSPYAQSAINLYLRNERLLATTVTMNGGQLLSVLQPTLYLKKPFGVTRFPNGVEVNELQTLTENYSHTVNYTVYGYHHLGKELARMAASQPGMTFLDTSAAFDGVEEGVFGDNVHLNERGYQLLAARLAPTLADLLATKSPPRPVIAQTANGSAKATYTARRPK